MSQSITGKAVNQMVEAFSDVRFNPELFATQLAFEKHGFEIEYTIMQIIHSYLKALSQDYVYGLSYSELSEQAFKMLRAIGNEGGIKINLDPFDT